MEQLIIDLLNGEDVRLHGERVYLNQSNEPCVQQRILTADELCDIECITY